MKKKFLSFLTLVFLIITTACQSKPEVDNTPNDKDIVVLFTNDIHCGIDENIGLAGMMKYYKDLDNQGVYKTLVDTGDFSQGNSYGIVSRGEELFNLMSKLGYDFIVPGNHEFDYGYKKLIENSLYLTNIMYSCNIIDLTTDKPFFDGYKILTMGNKKLAFVGATIPWTVTSTSPKNLRDANCTEMVGFLQEISGKKFIDTVQKNIDEARAEGANYVVLAAHIGEFDFDTPFNIGNIVSNLTGIDAVLCGHSHSVFNTTYTTKDGKQIPAAEAGTKMQNFGRLNITKDGKISMEIIDKVDGKDIETEKLIEGIKERVEKLTSDVIYKDNKVHFTVNNPATGKRAIRNAETNLGDFVADAFRHAGKTDVAFVNGGGIRADMPIGDITFNDAINVVPFYNLISSANVTGQQLLDLLEFTSAAYPEEFGAFMQVSGLSYEIDATKPTNVKVDDNGDFIKVDGDYRVKNVMVGDEPLDVSKTYTATATNFIIKEGGNGCVMFKGAKFINDDFTIDTEVVADYLSIADMSKYQDPYGEGRIKIIVE